MIFSRLHLWVHLNHPLMKSKWLSVHEVGRMRTPGRWHCLAVSHMQGSPYTFPLHVWENGHRLVLLEVLSPYPCAFGPPGDEALSLQRVFYYLGAIPGTQRKHIETDGTGGAVAWQRPLFSWKAPAHSYLEAMSVGDPMAGTPRGSRSTRGRPVPSLLKLLTGMWE